MSRSHLAAGALVLLAAMSPGALPSPRQQEAWQRVEDRGHTVSIDVPSGWRILVPDRGPLRAVSPDGEASVTVALERIGTPMTGPDGVVARMRARLAALRMVTVVSTRHIAVDGSPAEEVEYTGTTSAGTRYGVVQLAQVRGDLVLVATGTWVTTSPQAARHAAMARHSVESIRVLSASQRSTTTHDTVPAPRRDLFAAPPSAPRAEARPRAPAAALPPLPVPSAPGPPVPPGGVVLPPPPAPVTPGPTAPPGATAAPPGATQQLHEHRESVALIGVVLGPTPQAVLSSGTRIVIASAGQTTPWGVVRSIRAGTVTLVSQAETRILSLPGGQS